MQARRARELADVFISYARSAEEQAHRVADGLRSLGYAVWRDDELPAHRSYSDVIDEHLASAKAVVVLWSTDAVKSEWVRAEADVARTAKKLVQLSIDGADLPLPFSQLHCADLKGWAGDPLAKGWKSVVAGVAELAGNSSRSAIAETAKSGPPRLSMCVLPFANMSGDPEQEYFSDGISEDIITDLSKVSALSVVARNTAFTFKCAAVDARRVAAELGVEHILEGSVRKSGGRVRITAQLIEGVSGSHIWAERYDRELTDIFALQDEISQTIVEALKLRLLPAEKEAIERRGTANVEAYNLFLMARQHSVGSSEADSTRNRSIIRLCRKVVEIDPEYADAWALMALAQTLLFFADGAGEEDGLKAAERALALNPALAEPHAVRARHLANRGLRDEAFAEIQTALQLAPDSFEVNSAAAALNFRERRTEDAIRFFEKAMTLMESDLSAPGMLITCYKTLGDLSDLHRVAEIALSRAERALAADPSSGKALAFGVNALAALGDASHAREWIERALVVDPENRSTRFNCACALSAHLNDADAAIELLAPIFERAPPSLIDHAMADTDLDPIRTDPRFQKMISRAQARIAAAGPGSPPIE
jgi:adenylate cyclase